MTPTWARCLPVALAVPVVLAVPAALEVPVALPVCLQCRTWAPRMMRWKSISPAAP